MPKMYTIGSTQSSPGSLQYGRWEAFQHPTGQAEFLPVVIAQGKQDGPCLWLTAGIHGPEHTGPLVLHELLTEELVERMRGTIVAIPALNPVGLRTAQRQPHPDDKDPNRLWPDGKPEKPYDPDKEPPTPLEVAYKALFDTMLESADFLIDYHNAWIASISFSFQDRVLYKADGDGQAKKAAQELLDRQTGMLRAYGHTIICEMPTKKLIDEELHRSTSAALSYLGGKPAFTVELGGGQMPDPAIVRASAAGTRNVMRWAGMLDGELEAIEGIQVIDPGYPVRRLSTPRMQQAGVVMHLVQSGEMVEKGQPVAEVRDIWGRPIGDGVLHSEYDGFVLGRSHGIMFYPGQAVMTMAVPLDGDMVEPYPEDYFN
ncbi:MAG: succinylglutamate desuccinylase/aspartoacylase family protein [Anaerolineales bacterium]